MEADQEHKTALGEISPGMRSEMMANMFATLRAQVCMLTFMWDLGRLE
jgi:hypothetical protein